MPPSRNPSDPKLLKPRRAEKKRNKRPAEDLKTVKVIGAGAAGVVRLVMNKKTGEHGVLGNVQTFCRRSDRSCHETETKHLPPCDRNEASCLHYPELQGPRQSEGA